MKQLYIILLAIIPLTSVTQPWEWSNPQPTGNQVNGVTFSSPTKGFIVGNYGTLLTTENGGEDWELIPWAITDDLRDVAFANATTGLIVTLTGKIFKTTDAGNSWDLVYDQPSFPLRSVAFPSPDTGFALGSNIFLRSIDGGDTWQVTSYNNFQTGHSLCFVDSKNGFFSDGATFWTSTANIMRTTDGGSTWTSVATLSEIVTSLWFVDPLNGFLCTGIGDVWKSIDGGISWQKILNGPSIYFDGIRFFDAENGLVVGEEGYIMKTSDGGANWAQAVVSTTKDLKGLFILSPTHSVITGANLTFGGVAEPAILLTTDGVEYFDKVTGSWADCFDIQFPSSQTGFVACDSGIILKTTNGGDHWSRLNTGTDKPLRKLFFPSPSLGWAVGTMGTILHTIDAGLTWATQTSGTQLGLNSIYFSDLQTGYAVGEFGTILKTSNGGNTWMSKPSGTLNFLYDVQFISIGIGYVVGDEGTILKTTDGGETWLQVGPGVTGMLFGVHFLTNDLGYITGQIPGILKTTDGGVSWITIEGPNVGYLNDICFRDENTAYAVGPYGKILLSTDGGETWIQQKVNTENYFLRVCITDLNCGYVVGTHGTIMRTFDFPVGNFGTTVSELKWVSSYPNPASTFITIETTPHSEFFVFSNDGKEHIRQKSRGNTTRIDVSTLPSGIYLVKVIGEKGVQVGKFVKNCIQ